MLAWAVRETCYFEEPETRTGACDGMPCSYDGVNQCCACGSAICTKHTVNACGKTYCPECYRDLN